MVDEDVLVGSLRAYMKSEADKSRITRSSAPAKDFSSEISPEAGFSYLLKHLDFPSRLVLRLLKMYL